MNAIRTDDALGAVQQGRVDVALIRGHLTSAPVRMVHLFDEARVAVCSVRRPETIVETTNFDEWWNPSPPIGAAAASAAPRSSDSAAVSRRTCR